MEPFYLRIADVEGESATNNAFDGDRDSLDRRRRRRTMRLSPDEIEAEIECLQRQVGRPRLVIWDAD